MFETRNQEVLLKQNHGKKINLDLRNVILLDSQSTMDLFCNPNLINKIRKSKSMMKLQSNGGRIVVNQKATMSGYHAKAWFSRKAIANIFALSNLIKQYHVTYDSKDQMFVVHRETKTSRTWSSRCTRMACITLIQETWKLSWWILSWRTRKVFKATNKRCWTG